MTKLVFGVGLNDGIRSTILGDCKNQTVEYKFWIQMLRRCYDKKYHAIYQTYIDCQVSDSFKNYSYFYDWCQEQVGFGKKGWHLDKDILCKDNKMYSENTCIFVPSEINTFFTSSRKTRGDYPVGVSLQTGYTKYIVTVCVAGKNKNLGRYHTVEEAFAVYKKHKEALCKQLALKWKDEIDPRVYEAMMKWEVDITS